MHSNISQGGTVGGQNPKSSPWDPQDPGKGKHPPPKIHCQGGNTSCCGCWEKIRCLQKLNWQGRHQMQNKRFLCIQPLPWGPGWPSPEKPCWARTCFCKQIACCLSVNKVSPAPSSTFIPVSGPTSMRLGFQRDRWGRRTPEDTTSFSGKGFDYTSSSPGVFAALAPGRRVVGSSHPPWP